MSQPLSPAEEAAVAMTAAIPPDCGLAEVLSALTMVFGATLAQVPRAKWPEAFVIHQRNAVRAANEVLEREPAP